MYIFLRQEDRDRLMRMADELGISTMSLKISYWIACLSPIQFEAICCLIWILNG